MVARTLYGIILFFLAAAFLSCKTVENREQAMTTQEQAVEIAKKELLKHDYVLADFDITVGIDTSNAEYWIVWFEKSGPFQLPGGGGAVRVNKQTGAAELMRGE